MTDIPQAKVWRSPTFRNGGTYYEDTYYSFDAALLEEEVNKAAADIVKMRSPMIGKIHKVGDCYECGLHWYGLD